MKISKNRLLAEFKIGCPKKHAKQITAGQQNDNQVSLEEYLFCELSKAPEWYVNLDEDTQKRVEHLFEDENNVDKGKLK